MPPRNRPRQAQEHNARNAGDDRAGQAGDQGNPQPEGAEDDPHLFDENTTSEELREIVTQLQLQNNTQKRQLTDITVERNDLLTSQGRKRRRAPPQDPTPLDPKYQSAGKRCALFWMLWITPDLHEITIDEAYSEETRYQENEPAMELQGEQIDMLLSMAEEMIQGFNDEEHFRKVFGDALGEQRRTTASRVRACGSLIFGCTQDQFTNSEFRISSEDFKDLLGFQADEATTNMRWPPLAPVLYIDGQTQNPNKAFRSQYIKGVFRCYMFGPTSIDGPLHHHGGPKVLAEVLSVKTITVSAIAAAATLTCWAISPDKEFKKTGPTTGIQWRSNYQQYKKLLIKSINAEKGRYNRTGEIGPYSQLIDEWNSEFFPNTREDNPDMRRRDHIGDAPDIEAALAQAKAYGRGD